MSSMYLNVPPQFGTARAIYLSGDNLGNCKVMIPAVSGQVPIDALSIGFTSASPGDAGWVTFEGGDASMPVWMGTMKPDPTNWNAPWGIQAANPIVADQTVASGSFVDAAGFTATWQGALNRLYRITAIVANTQNTSTANQGYEIMTGASGTGTILSRQFTESITGGSARGPSFFHAFYEGVNGSMSAHLQVFTGAGTLTLNNTQAKGWFVVEDVGPRINVQVVANPPQLQLPSNMAFGVLAWKLGVHSGSTFPANTNVFANVLRIYEFQNVTMQSGRRYCLRFRVRAVQNNQPYYILYKDGAFVTDYYGAAISTVLGGEEYSWEINGSEHPGTHTWTVGMSSQTGGTGLVFTNGDSASFSDIGPTSGPIQVVAAPTVGVGSWTDFSSSLVWSSNSTQPVLGNGVQEAQYRVDQYGECLYEGAIYFGTTTTAGAGTYSINIPFVAHQSGIVGTNTPWIGSCKFFNSGTGLDLPGIMQIYGGSNVNFSMANNGGSVGGWTPTAPTAPTSGKNFCWTIKYRIAGS